MPHDACLAQDAALNFRGRAYAAIVRAHTDPESQVENDLKAHGAHVTRLLASVLLPRRPLDGQTLRMLGRLYAGLIIPVDACRSRQEVASAAGVPVVYECENVSGLRR